ncbi:MAG: hypothetical protein ACI92Z_001423, partial [Paracoccaceae bacterium]
PKTTKSPNRRLDQPTKKHGESPSLNSKCHRLKIVDTFRYIKLEELFGLRSKLIELHLFY